MGLIGDAPVCCCRWRLDRVEGQQVALLDRIAVRADYRMRGIARAAVAHVLTVHQRERGAWCTRELMLGGA
jgi:hypothetical protein